MLDWLLAPFEATAFAAFGVPVSWGEVLGVATGALTVWLVVRQHLANWPIGIANNAFFLLLFAHAGIYADAGLQVVYAALGAYGWWAWLRGGEARSRLRVSRTTAREWVALTLAGAVATALLWWVLVRASDSTVPLPDAFTTALSLCATWGQCRKKVESWWLWIAVDVVYVPLYIVKGLVLTALLYAAFIVLCVLGLRAWRAALAVEEHTAASVPAPA